MAVGAYVWIGVNPTLSPDDDGFELRESVADTRDKCEKRIIISGHKEFVPSKHLLILKGKMT